jgi:fumarylacetoacetase
MAIELDDSHDPQRRSWVASANHPGCNFPIQNLPFGMYRLRDSSDNFRACTAIGDQVFDLAGVDAVFADNLNALASAGRSTWHDLRQRLSTVLSDPAQAAVMEKFLQPMSTVELGLPVHSSDYSDFFTSYYHAFNSGKLFRPDAPLTPNFKWMPIAYHGRTSSIVVSGTPVQRPWGQLMPAGAKEPVFAPSQWLDYEMELGVVIGPGTAMGEQIDIANAEDHIFGLCILNDWSARDIQAWEYQPLGPFLAKSFASTVSPWIVTLEALAPFRAPAFQRFEGDPAALAHLTSHSNARSGHFDIQVAVKLQPREASQAYQLSQATYASSYWNPAQMVTHQASNGCPLSPGDLLGTGTISGSGPDSAGCLLELTEMGGKPLRLGDNIERTALRDGDTVMLSAACEHPDYRSIGFGNASGVVLPACVLPGAGESH